MELLERKGIRLIVHLPEEVDHHHTEEIRRKVDAVIRKEPVDEENYINRIIFDFSGTEFMDSAGIGMIFGRYQMLKALNGRIVLSHMNSRIDRVLELSCIRNYIPLEKEEK